MYKLLFCKFPFSPKKKKGLQIESSIKKGVFKLYKDKDWKISLNFLRIMCLCLKYEPYERITHEDLKAVFNKHPTDSSPKVSFTHHSQKIENLSSEEKKTRTPEQILGEEYCTPQAYEVILIQHTVKIDTKDEESFKKCCRYSHYSHIEPYLTFTESRLHQK